MWGSTFVVLQSSLELISPFVLIALRFGSAALLIAALRPRAARDGLRIAPAILPLSLSMFAGFSLQTVGLSGTTPARSAFLTSLSVVLVPFIEYLSTRRWPKSRLLAAVALATAGVAALFQPIGSEWRQGDSLTLLGAVAFAFYIVELGILSRRHGAVELVIAQFATIFLLALGFGLAFERPRFAGSALAFGALIYLSLICTVLTFLLMTWAQARVEAIEAGVVYTLEPVIAGVFSVALGRESLSANLLTGGLLILAGMLVVGTTPSAAPPRPVEGID